MAFNISGLNGNFVNPYKLVMKFETNNTSDPDGLVPNYGNDVLIERSGTGTITITFIGSKKPFWVAVNCYHEEDDADLKVVSSGYVQDTGVVTLKTYTNSGGTWTAADTTDETVVVELYCTQSSEGGRLAASA
jgi:hypothetical protein